MTSCPHCGREIIQVDEEQRWVHRDTMMARCNRFDPHSSVAEAP